ncbi:Uma2 family endonuclease [Streptomyces alkaliterrae]|uniref:Uma2 family endonuclease n=1 Tax=Streptomyces alkaliterrae TaxID=2213162 RepID=A0A5P0YMM5_9ACTN|nr:Uma2 family endonuclease [Streptomyces alkaliterrae]MBB1259770.1 Uma2 family endonuclease [Streptomyces alkaliterrae]MQS01583.1 Uma2 family endonuclease [Streptomyces alkaliterrae]
MTPPRPSGWEPDDLDQLPEAPRHTELVEGALLFRLTPQPSWRSRLLENLTFALRQAAPDGFEVEREMTVRLDRKSRPEPVPEALQVAQARLPHFWRVEDETAGPEVHTYELDAMTGTYVPTGIHRGRLKVAVPFPLDVDLTALVP